MLWVLGGYGINFTLLGLGSVLTATNAITTAAGSGILIIVRIAHGLTVSATVSVCQVWVLQRAGEGNRMAVLAIVGSGLSCGGLFGSLCAAAMLVIHSLAPLGLLMTVPVLALLVLLRLPGTSPQLTPEYKSVSLKRGYLPYLLCAILLAAATNTMQLGLLSALTRQFATDTTTISQQVVWLLGLSVAAALIAQFGVLRPQRLTPMALLLSVGVLVSGGPATTSPEQLWLFYPGCVVLSLRAAPATPTYQLLLNGKLVDGAGADWLIVSHTLGYGPCALLVPSVSKTGVAIMPIMIALFVIILSTIMPVSI